MDRARWRVLLAEAPPRDTRTAEEFGSLLVGWSYDQLKSWYEARFKQDLTVREELGEVVGQFLRSIVRGNFGCLARVAVDHREGYLRTSLQRRVARHFARVRELQEHFSLLADDRVGEDGEERALDADDFVAGDPSPEEQVLRKMEWDEALAEVTKMARARRDVFHDRYEVGLTARETAAHLHIPLGTVQWHDREIVKALRRHFVLGGP
jgi:DNA-directed RNA polymerase specialized sigma24 family protein